MSNLDRRLRALEASSASSSDFAEQVDCDASGLTVEQRELAEQALAEWERLRVAGDGDDLLGFIAALPDATKRALARIRIVGEA